MNMSCTVKWNGSMSRIFDIPSGTKQGGILSPEFFALYMHELIEILQSCGFGCRVIQVCIACLFFADDLVLFSPSRYGVQKLLNICASYCKKFCLDFNVGKSKVMVVGKPLPETQFAPLLLNDYPLDYVNEYKYLGVELHGGKSLSFSPLSTIRSFHRAANSILYSRVKPDKSVLMKLLYTNCVSTLSYIYSHLHICCQRV